jgi:hypothetical protein
MPKPLKIAQASEKESSLQFSAIEMI